MMNRCVVLFVATASWSGFGWIHVAAAQAPPSVESLDQRTADLETRLATIESSLTNISQQLNTLLTKPLGTPAAPGDGSLEVRMQNLEEAHGELERIVREISTQHLDGYAPNILGKMSQSGAFRNEMAAAVQGKLSFRNNTGIDQVVHVNGTPWRVLAGASYTRVPYGVVTISMAPHLSPLETNDWEFKGSNPEMVIVIE